MFPKLSDYPKFQLWFDAHADAPPREAQAPDRLVWSVARAFAHQDSTMGLKIWINAIKQFFHVANADELSFLKAEEIFDYHGIDFLRSASDVAEFAIAKNYGRDFSELMQSIANRLSLNVFRFLSAWTALNTNQLELCVSECEKIDEPFACVFTLQGQACLELGRVDEAIENLKLALQLNEQDVMTMFQLAKAYHVKNQFSQAWEQLNRCEILRPGHPEVLALKAMTAMSELEVGTKQQWLSITVPQLIALLREDPANASILSLTMEAILHQDTSDCFKDLAMVADWDAVRNQPDFLATVPEILRAIDSRGWRHLAVEFLDKMVTKESV